MTVGERELLDAYRQSLRETIDFYSNRNKPARYLWVVRHFLQFARVPFSPSDLVSVVQDPPDVCFGTTAFEVKERKGTFYFSDGNMTNCVGTVIQWNRNLRVSTFFQASGLPELQRPS